MTQAELDKMVAAQRYDKTLAFLRAQHSPEVGEWGPRWWGEQIKAGHVPLTYEMATQLIKKNDPQRSMQMFGMAYAGTALDGALCADTALGNLKQALLRDYLKEWDNASSANAVMRPAEAVSGALSW